MAARTRCGRAPESCLQGAPNCGKFAAMDTVDDHVRIGARSNTSNGGYRGCAATPARLSRRQRDLMGIVLGLGIGMLLDVWLSDETFFELVARIWHGFQ